MPNKIIEGQSPYREKPNIGTLSTLAGIGFLVSACATPANGEGNPTLSPTAISVTEVVPTPPTPEDPIKPDPNPAGYGTWPLGLTPTPDTSTATPEPTTTSETPISQEIFVAPTVEDAIKRSGEGGAVPEHAIDKYNALLAIKPEIAESCGVEESNLNIVYRGGSVGNEFRWNFFAETTDGEICLPVVESTGLIPEYSMYFLPGTNVPMGKQDGVGWTKIDGAGGWCGTRPCIFGGEGTVIVDGQEVPAYSRYILPGGYTAEQLKNLEIWTPIAGVTENEKLSSAEWWAALESDVEHQLTPVDLEILELEGKGIAIKTEFEGVPVSISVLASTDVLDGIGGIGPALNQNLPSGQEQPSINRLAEVVLMGHWMGYTEDHGQLPFDTYLAKWKAGEDMSYVIMGYAYGSSEATEITVDPTKPVELVAENQVNGVNGRSPIKNTTAFGYGYSLNEDGSLRIIVRNPTYTSAEHTYSATSISFSIGLWVLGLDLSEQNPGYNLEQLGLNAVNDDPERKMMTGIMAVNNPEKGYSGIGDTIIVSEDTQ